MTSTQLMNITVGPLHPPKSDTDPLGAAISAAAPQKSLDFTRRHGATWKSPATKNLQETTDVPMK